MSLTPEIGLVGVGKLGICLALSLEHRGFNVLCNDINISLLDSIKNKTLESTEPHINEMLYKSKNLLTTHNIYDIFSKNLIFILVATPSLPDGSYDHSAIEQIVSDIEKYYITNTVNDKKYLVICSTVMPKYCDNLQERLSKYNIEVNYNPEFIAQGSIIRDMNNPDMVLIGERSKEAGDIIEHIYKTFVNNTPKICRVTPLEAEITKIALNCFLTTKIAFANCIGDLSKKVGADPTNVLSAIGSDSRIGNKYLRWGFGFGGPCFPRDNRALNFFARNENIVNNIGEATDISNKIHLDNLINLIELNIPKAQNILFTSVSYKPESIILEESQQLQLAVALHNKGYNIYIKEREIIKHYISQMYPNIAFNYLLENETVSNYIDINYIDINYYISN